jgi:hypothetical protein
MSDKQLQTRDATLPGSVLAEPVTDAGGAVLLPAGLTLTEAHLESLRRRGIENLCVMLAVDPAELAQRREKARLRIMHLFRHTADDPGSQALLHAILAFREEQMK